MPRSCDNPRPGIIEIGDRRELLLDDFLAAEFAGGAHLRLHEPVPREAALVIDRPWEGCMGAFTTVLDDGEKYRMYYRGWQMDLDGFSGMSASRPVTVCLATSTDGLHWERPAINRFNYQGIEQNNIVWMGEGEELRGMHGFGVFIDANPACPPEKRWKAVGAPWKESSKGLDLMASPDGIGWAIESPEPFFSGYALDSHNLVFWDAQRAEYRACFRHWTKDAFSGRRTIVTATSADLISWTEPVELQYPGASTEELYVSNIQPYYRAPHILVGFPTRYVERKWTPSMEGLPELEHRRLRANANERFGTALTDAVFMSSRDGVTYRRWGEAFIRPGLRSAGNWTYGDNFLAWGMLETGSDLPGGGKEISFYNTEGYWRGESTTFRRYTLRIDGFVSLNAPMAGGEFTTRPLVFRGGRLSLNLSTSVAGSVYVEMQDETGRAIPGFGVDDCWEIVGDSLDYTVNWKHGIDVGGLSGVPIRLRFSLRDADLYSFKFDL